MIHAPRTKQDAKTRTILEGFRNTAVSLIDGLKREARERGIQVHVRDGMTIKKSFKKAHLPPRYTIYLISDDLTICTANFFVDGKIAVNSEVARYEASVRQGLFRPAIKPERMDKKEIMRAMISAMHLYAPLACAS